MKKFYLLGLPLLTLVLAGCFHVKPVTTSQPSAEETITSETTEKTNVQLETKRGILRATLEDTDAAILVMDDGTELFLVDQSTKVIFPPFIGKRVEVKGIFNQPFNPDSKDNVEFDVYEISSQNTYKNAELGFSFQYPKNWIVSTDPYLKKSLLSLWIDPRPVPEAEGEPVPTIGIAVHESVKKLDTDHKGVLSLKDYLEKYRNVCYGYDGCLYSGEMKEVQIGDRNGYWVRTGGLVFAPDEYFFVSLNSGVIIEIDRYNKGEDNEETEAIVKAILASFEFTK